MLSSENNKAAVCILRCRDDSRVEIVVKRCSVEKAKGLCLIGSILSNPDNFER